jgi:hypothetical protein
MDTDFGVRGHVRALVRRDISRRGKRRLVAALQTQYTSISTAAFCADWENQRKDAKGPGRKEYMVFALRLCPFAPLR